MMTNPYQEPVKNNPYNNDAFQAQNTGNYNAPQNNPYNAPQQPNYYPQPNPMNQPQPVYHALLRYLLSLQVRLSFITCRCRVTLGQEHVLSVTKMEPW